MAFHLHLLGTGIWRQLLPAYVPSRRIYLPVGAVVHTFLYIPLLLLSELYPVLWKGGKCLQRRPRNGRNRHWEEVNGAWCEGYSPSPSGNRTTHQGMERAGGIPQDGYHDQQSFHGTENQPHLSLGIYQHDIQQEFPRLDNRFAHRIRQTADVTKASTQDTGDCRIVRFSLDESFQQDFPRKRRLLSCEVGG